MPIAGPLHLFDPISLDRVPDEAGVFALYESDELIFYGHALESLRDQLETCLVDPSCRCMRRAILFNVEVCDYPAQRELELIREHQVKLGKLPRCNELIA